MHDPRSGNLFGTFIVAAHDRLLQDLADQSPLAPQTAAALVVIRHNPGEAIHFLSAALELTHSGTVRVVDTLCAAGLVLRVPGVRGDARVVSLKLTDAGEREVQRVLAIRRRYVEKLLASLTREETAGLTKVVERLLAQLTVSQPQSDHMCRFCEEDVCPQDRCPITLAIPRDAAGNYLPPPPKPAKQRAGLLSKLAVKKTAKSRPGAAKGARQTGKAPGSGPSKTSSRSGQRKAARRP